MILIRFYHKLRPISILAVKFRQHPLPGFTEIYGNLIYLPIYYVIMRKILS